MPKIPSQAAARGALPPRKFRINSGSTGMMMPSAIISSATVMRMKTRAAFRVFMGALNFDTAPVYAKYELKSMNSSTHDKAEGTAKEVIGAVKEKTGEVDGQPGFAATAAQPKKWRAKSSKKSAT